MNHPSISTILIASSLAALAGCAAAAPPPAVVADGMVASGYRMPISPDTTIEAASDRALAQAYIDETLRVIGSPAFARNLAGVGEDVGAIWRGPFGGRSNSREVAAAYLGRVPAHRAVTSTLRWSKDEKVAVTDWVDDADDIVITLGTQKKTWWASDSIVDKSCAINSLAHELAHTVPRSQSGFRYLFTDAGRRWSTRFGTPLASYVIGAVAQCTYLDEHQQMTGGSLAICVEHWGRNVFQSDDCS